MVKRWVKDGCWYVFGSVLYALSISLFSNPNRIAPGGAAGIGVILNELAGIPVGVTVLAINIPLMIAAFCRLPRSFTWRTAIVIVLSSVIMDMTAPLIRPFREDRLLAALFGGLLAGIGIGMIMLRNASTGGSEIVARLIQKQKPHLTVGRLLMAVDAVVIALSAIVFADLSAALYAAVQVFVSSVMIDRIVYDHEEGRLLMIISSHPLHISESITTHLGRGVTKLRAVGGYTGQETTMLLCAVSRAQVPPLKRLIYRADPSAFVMVVVTEQVLGEGFLPTVFEEIHE